MKTNKVWHNEQNTKRSINAFMFHNIKVYTRVQTRCIPNIRPFSKQVCLSLTILLLRLKRRKIIIKVAFRGSGHISCGWRLLFSYNNWCFL